MTISQRALADLLLNYFTTLEPVGRDVTLKNEMVKLAQPDGSTRVQMVPTKGDLYIPRDLANAMAKAIAKALWPQFEGSSPYSEPWFVWNSKDLTQFDSVVYGPQVNQGSSIVDVVTYVGLKWIRMKIVSTAGATSGTDAGMVLPISVDPPSTDYVVLAEFISRTRSGARDTVGAGVVARFQDMEHGYTFRYEVGNPLVGFTEQSLATLDPGYTMRRLVKMADPRIDTNDQGMFIGVAVEGPIIRALGGEKSIFADQSYTAKGKAGLFQSTVGEPSATVENYYRSIRCYEIDVMRYTVP
jgi:hypothetical protein